MKKQLQFTLKNKNIQIFVPEHQITSNLISILKANPQTPDPQNLIALYSSSIPLNYILSHPEKAIEIKNIRNGETFHGVYTNLTQKPQKLEISNFFFEKCIGKGGTSEVFLGMKIGINISLKQLVRHMFSGRLFALKMVNKHYLNDCRRLEAILREKKLLTQVLHQSKYVIPLYATFATKEHLCFLLEYFAGGELFLHLQRNALTHSQIKYYFKEALQALQEVHLRNVLYRDLKPENILLDHEGKLYISDFGLSKILKKADQMAQSFCGSPEYMPPEIVKHEPYNFSGDYYSLGCLLHEFMFGLPPFYSQDPQELMENVIHQELQLPSDLEKEVQEILHLLLNKDPQQRDINRVLQSQWLVGIQKKPIKIDLYENYIHEEFDCIDANVLNQSVGELENEDDLYDFFYYVNPLFNKMTDQSEKQLPNLGSGMKSLKNRVQSEHQLINSAKNKKFVVNKELKHIRQMLSPTHYNFQSDFNINFTSQSAKLLPYLEKQQTAKQKTRGSLQHNHHSEHHLSVKNQNKSPNLTTKQQSRLVTLIKPKTGNSNFIKT